MGSRKHESWELYQLRRVRSFLIQKRLSNSTDTELDRAIATHEEHIAQTISKLIDLYKERNRSKK